MEEEYEGLLGLLARMNEPDNVETLDIRQPERWYDYYRPILAQQEQPHYMVGTRPLDLGMSSAIRPSAVSSSRNDSKDGYHYQFVRNDGKTFGYGRDGVFEENVRPYAFDAWRFGDMAFNAPLVDEARKLHAARTEAGLLPKSYNPFLHNCHDYANEVLDIAREIAIKRRNQ